jgi:hypothetical protein
LAFGPAGLGHNAKIVFAEFKMGAINAAIGEDLRPQKEAKRVRPDQSPPSSP